MLLVFVLRKQTENRGRGRMANRQLTNTTGEFPVKIHLDSEAIQLTRTTSSRTTSQVTRPDDNKAIGTCFHALLAGHRPASLILARRIAFPLLLLGAGLVVVPTQGGSSGAATKLLSWWQTIDLLSA
jgi:hypothetical protein